jgi:hypothetical protein
MKDLTRFLCFACALGVAAVASCGGDETSSGSNSSSNNNTGGADTGGNAAGGTNNVGGGTGGLFNNTGGGNVGGMMACASEEAQAETAILNMIVVLDRSASMEPNLWTPSKNALSAYFNDMNQTGTNVAMTFFPIENPADNNGCNISHYDPPHVPFEPIPTNANVLINAMNAENASGPDTPTYGAIYGTLQYANAHQDLNPNEVTIVVFASDGDPNGCTGNQNDIPIIAGVAQSALNYNGVRTYVIAINGADVAALDTIAAAGGTTQAFDVTMNTAQFTAAMENIKGQALACEFLIPTPSNPNEFDPLKVNVTYTPGGSNTPENLLQANDAADCGTEPGWYYDNPVNPTKIFLCPATCTTVQADSAANVKFLFGCPTELN